MRIMVDLNRCQGYAQCVFLAPDVFELHGEEALRYEPNPDHRLLIATGTRARPWFNPTEAALKGVYTIRTRDDAARVW
jgi:ferredoxin